MDRAWPLGGSLLCCSHVRAKLGLPPIRLGLGGPGSHHACAFLRAPTSAVPPPSTWEEVDKNSKVEVRLTRGVIDPDEDNTNRRRRPAHHRRPRSGRTKTSLNVGPDESRAPPSTPRGGERHYAAAVRSPPALQLPEAVRLPPRDQERPPQPRGGYRDRASTPAPTSTPYPP